MATPDYGSMTHAQLVSLRDALSPTDPQQDVLAPYEHQAFARQWTEDSPVLAPLSLTFAIPAYSAAKALGLERGRSDASWNEMLSGYRGMAEGIAHNMQPVVGNLYQLLHGVI